MELGYASYEQPETGNTASIALHKVRQRYQVQVRVNRRIVETDTAASEQEAQHAARCYQTRLCAQEGMRRCA